MDCDLTGTLVVWLVCSCILVNRSILYVVIDVILIGLLSLKGWNWSNRLIGGPAWLKHCTENATERTTFIKWRLILSYRLDHQFARHRYIGLVSIVKHALVFFQLGQLASLQVRISGIILRAAISNCLKSLNRRQLRDLLRSGLVLGNQADFELS